MDSPVLIVAAGAAIAGFVQGLSGFAFGLVAMGIWAWSLDPVLAGPLVVFGSLVGQLLASASLWRAANLWRAWPLVAGGVLGVPLGVVLLHYMDPQVFKAAVGLLLVSEVVVFHEAERVVVCRGVRTPQRRADLRLVPRIPTWWVGRHDE